MRVESKVALIAMVVALSVALLPPTAQAIAPTAPTGLTRTLLAKAAPDECFNGIGVDYPSGPPCAEGRPKVNHSYIWGMFKLGTQLWFGTIANVNCVGSGPIFSGSAPLEEPHRVCEFGQSQRARHSGVPPRFGDARTPRIYQYDTTTGTLTDRTPDDPLLGFTAGIRSTGGLGNMVIHAGPSLAGDAIHLFAFQADNGAYLGSASLFDYENIRKWIVVDDVLYTTVELRDGRGAILRWRGSVEHPFELEIVGLVDSGGWEIGFHEDRLFVTTQAGTAGLVTPGLWMSPPLPEGGLTVAAADSWQQVWSARGYEPDPIVAFTYVGGALASYDGFLYWGTTHLPGTAAQALGRIYGVPATPEDQAVLKRNSHRAVTVWRGRNLGADDRQIELLYGEAELPAYRPESGWSMQPNQFGAPPLYGSSGFGNPYNVYAWTMATFDGSLYVGTLDWSSVAPPEWLEAIPPTSPPGADLWRFDSALEGAVPEDLSGLGNLLNLGIRTMVADDALFLGTANPFNLATDPNDDLPEGGWELIRLH